MARETNKKIDKDVSKRIRTLDVDMERGVEMGMDTGWDMDIWKRIWTWI